jgi:hypothetical protein
MTRQLAGARFVTTADYLGSAVRAYVFERHGKVMMALWTTSQKTYDVTLPVGGEKSVTSTGLFGRVVPLDVRDGLVRVKVDRNPQFVGPLAGSQVGRDPVATVDGTIEALPGQSAQAQLVLVNRQAAPARLRIEWLPASQWRLELAEQEWSLAANERRTVALTATASSGQPVGQYQVHARVFRDDKYFASMVAPARVLPQATISSVQPGIHAGRPALVGTLRRLDSKLDKAVVRLDGGAASSATVAFGTNDTAAFSIPVGNPEPTRLGDYRLAVLGSGDRVQAEESIRASFVAAGHAGETPVIDGDLGDWPGLADQNALALQWKWDERNLYLAVRVRDATHVQNQSATQTWKEDSIQVALAPGQPGQLERPFEPGMLEHDMTLLDVALGRQGPAIYRHMTLNKQLAPDGVVSPGQISRAIRHGAGITTYELKIPAAQVGLKPLAAGQVLRASVLLNSSNGQGRETTEWFSGIRGAKDPALFGHLILVK